MTTPQSVGRRTRVPTAAPWAATVGYSRAVRVEGRILVSGTAAVQDDGSVGPVGDPYGQARRCLEIIRDALAKLGAGPEHVLRTRVYLADAADWPEVGRAHGEMFGDVRPVTTFVQVAGFIDPAIIVEIEAEAAL